MGISLGTQRVSGRSLASLEKTRGFGMTPSEDWLKQRTRYPAMNGKGTTFSRAEESSRRSRL